MMGFLGQQYSEGHSFLVFIGGPRKFNGECILVLTIKIVLLMCYSLSGFWKINRFLQLFQNTSPNGQIDIIMHIPICYGQNLIQGC